MKSKQHGGKRPGAGRPKKDRTPEGFFEDALSYLQAVTCGLVEPDALRIAAAKAILPYERPKVKTKKRSLPPAQLEAKETKELETAKLLEFNEKARRVKEKYLSGEDRK